MKVRVATAQYPITQHSSFDAWASHVHEWVAEASAQEAKLLVFPEYGAMELTSILPANLQSSLQGQVIELSNLQDKFIDVWTTAAQQNKVTIVAPSLPVIINGRPVNRAMVFSEKGYVGYQDKFFMTRFENEEWGISSGEKVLSIFEAEWGKFGIQICYDVEFPIGSQLLASEGAQLIVAPSCTETIRGATRVHIGARARALENQIYTAVSQTVGNALWSPAVDINYGYAAFYATPDKNLPEEGIISLGETQKPTWHYQTLDFELLDRVRADGQVFNFRDQQGIATKLLYHKIDIKKVQV